MQISKEKLCICISVFLVHPLVTSLYNLYLYLLLYFGESLEDALPAPLTPLVVESGAVELSQRLQGRLEVVLASPSPLQVLRLAGHKPCTRCPPFLSQGSLSNTICVEKKIKYPKENKAFSYHRQGK